MKERMERLTKEIEQHSYNYYVLDNPTITDFEYDRLIHELMELEKEYPQFKANNSPTERVGGKVLEGFETVTHAVPMESLNDAFSKEEIEANHAMRKALSGMKSEEMLEKYIDLFLKTRNNREFIEMTKKMH